ncbi:hypothetical protein CCUS01_11587 [Colletotrichum cuscutae]|uniref:Uncharacterized protein n=1 Tax=Colletotrichum cuscutae TaxID=1209917 RepID=A0AAI9U0Y3_9PEZI|nr:hypothetical protein CCUS01_11587 [Colletotrichum cuscutae]
MADWETRPDIVDIRSEMSKHTGLCLTSPELPT